MKKRQKEVKSNRLKKLEKKLGIIEKSKEYLEKELSKIREKEKILREKMLKERRAIALTNKAKILRGNKKK
jgi:hypothetical protein